jgi:NAD-reducing hydrogenase large subunit
MGSTITIAPVSRIEGHASITVQLDAQGAVRDTRFHVNEFRGFEKFCEGRLVWEMPGITSRICGICPSSHLITSAKAGDEIFAVAIPETAEKLRRLLTLAQWTQSHALSFFHLSSPDLLLGFDADPARRNIFGLMEEHREFIRRGIRLRKFGQEIIEILGGRRIHTPWAVAGGVREPLEREKRDYLLGWIPEARQTAQLALETIRAVHETYGESLQAFGTFHSLFMGLVGESGELEYYGGALRIMDSQGNILEDQLDPRAYHDHLAEATEQWSYLKFPYYLPYGYPKGMYRVGPLARVNVCDRITTPLAEAERQQFKKLGGSAGVVTGSFYYHYARLIELLFCVEAIEELLNDPVILGTHVRARAMINSLEGVGASEAPRGTLFHHYWVNEDGVLQRVNMLIATGQNNLAMNRTVHQIASHWIEGGRVSEGVLNRIEAGIRMYDPCLSCSTHAIGMMPMVVEVLDHRGALLSRTVR